MKSNFKRNLLIGFGASIVIFIATSVASFISINNLLRSNDLVNHTNKVIIGLNKINGALVDAETGQRGYLLTNDEEFLEPYHDAHARTLEVYEELKSLTADNSIQQGALISLLKLIEERFHYFDIGIDRKKTGQPLSVATLKQGRQVMEEIRSILKRLETVETDLLQQRTERSNRFAAFTPPLTISATLVALLITVMFYMRVRNDFAAREKLQQALEQKDKDISTRINIIKNIAEKISQGDYSIRINDVLSDALGSVAGSLNKMTASLQHSFELLSEKEWQQSGLAKLNDEMLGEKDFKTLTADVISFIASYTNANAAALYVLENNELCFASGYAYVPPATRERIQLNDGVLGQAIATGKLIELKTIPPENIAISFATGEAKPGHVIAIPIYDGYMIKGAMELATLTSFTKQHIEFLLASAPNIGVAIASAQNRRRLQELLEETMAQAEELKAQHADLENLNSELEGQTERLQASEEELKVQQEELRQANQELEERSILLEEQNQTIIERNEEIQANADQLAQSTKYKSEFLANMSHELRTPLNSILLLSRLMGENPEKNLTAGQIEYARVIQSAGQGLLQLIDEILDLSKIEAGKMDLDYQPTVLAEVVHDMADMFDPMAREKGIEFRTSLSPTATTLIEIDKLRLDQVLRNLLSNAIKFTADGYVSLEVVPADENHVKITIKDTGIGIPKDKQSLIFEAFQQADGSTRRKYGGTGLGLSISKELVKLLGGKISLNSEENKGSEFVITLPVSKDSHTNGEARESSVIASIGISDNGKHAGIKKYISTHIPANIPDDRNEIDASDKAILIVEDDVNSAKALLEFTRKRGYKGIVAVRGDEGIKLAKEFKPLGILLDIELPVKSGWEVMDELKNTPETRHIPVHIVSSHEVKSESLLKGAVDFINKPVAFDQMQQVFKKIEYVLTHHPKKVLIIEENAKHAKALSHFLQTFDLSLEIEDDVPAAIDALKNRNVDCVILDMGVPDTSTYETLEVVKKTPGLENLPIIIFTGKSLSSSEELKIKKYADSIVVKTAHSYKRILDEVSLFLHLMEKNQKDEPTSSRYRKMGALTEVLKNKTVLVADDDMRNIFSLTRALEKYSMNVIAAIDGADALQKLNANPDVDIVLMDMMMPQMDGYEATRTIRQDSRYKNLPIIAVTAKAMMGDREKCIMAGASDYITKPVDMDQLFSLLRVWLYESGKK